MTTTPITLEQVQDAAQQVVTDFGERAVNPGVNDGDGCKYTDEDGFHCVAGQIAVQLGVPVPRLMDNDNEVLVHQVEGFVEVFELDALDWLTDVQALADDGTEWAKAVAFVNGAS